MTTNNTLRDVFMDFASFGNRTSSGGLDGRGFVKLIKDCKLLDRGFTTTDADLIFSNTKVKPKSERKITYDEFLVALQLVAKRKRRPFDEILNQVTTHSPQAKATSAEANGGIFAKLTDTSKYTGAHKSRFDKEGKGTGRARGRRERSSSGSRPVREHADSGSREPNLTSPSRERSHSGTTKSNIPKGSIFDRLTDSSTYTGVYKTENRRGGINQYGGHTAHDLSAMTRPNLN